jgi:MFS family permease
MSNGRSSSAARKRPAHLGLAVALVAIGFALLAPTRIDIAILLREVMRGIGIASLAAAGLISTATLLGDGLVEIFCGHLSDRWSAAARSRSASHSFRCSAS